MHRACKYALVLEQLVRERYTAINAQPRERHSCISLHGTDDVPGLKGDALEHGARNMAPVVCKSQPDERGTCVVAPMRRKEAAKRRNEDKAIGAIGDLRGQEEISGAESIM